jgi:hypothetical protein
MTNPSSAEAEETADVPDEEYKEPSIRQIFLKKFSSIKSRDKEFAMILYIRKVCPCLQNSKAGVGNFTNHLSFKIELIIQKGPLINIY